MLADLDLAADIDPFDTRRLADGSRRVVAAYTAAIARHLGGTHDG